MRFLRDALITIVVLVLVLGGFAYVKVRGGGFSTTDQPGQLEKTLARRLVRLSVPDAARTSRNPYAADGDAWHEATDHFNDHCAVCHGRDGRGKTEVGENMYPPVPDLADTAVQQMGDGDIFFVIQNGVRWTGMPAWKHEHTPDETWKLVAFVRHVPSLTADENHRQPPEHSNGAHPHR